MKKRLFWVLAVLLIIAVVFTACSSNAPGSDKNDGGSLESADGGGGGASFAPDAAPVITERKVIYKASFSLIAEDVEQARTLIRSSIKRDLDERFEQENDYVGRSYFVARVRSDRLDAFVAAVSAGGERSDYSKTSTDVTQNYSAKESQIELLEAQRAAYIKILDKAVTTYDIMNVTAEIVRLDQQISNLNADLSKFDSEVEFSTVTINLYEKNVYTPPQEDSFGKRLGNAFVGGGKAILAVFEFLLLALGYTWPFLLIGGGITTGVLFLNKWNKKKRLAQQNGQNAAAREQGENGKKE